MPQPHPLVHLRPTTSVTEAWLYFVSLEFFSLKTSKTNALGVNDGHHRTGYGVPGQTGSYASHLEEREVSPDS